MTSKISTVLIIGGTSGIGEAFARRFHAAGKKVIVAGRRPDRLASLESELSSVETIQWDVTDFAQMPGKVSDILRSHPTLDTVFLNASIQKCFSLLDTSTSTPDSIIHEINSNLTAPILLARLFIPHLLSIASSGQPANLLITSSALAYVPLGFYPVYAPTKAGTHAFCIALRQQLGASSEAVKQNLSIVEIVPPYVDTDLDKSHRALTTEMQGGAEKAIKPMPLAEYMEKAFASLNELGPDKKMKKEVGVGFGEMGVDTWRGSFGKTLEGMGISC